MQGAFEEISLGSPKLSRETVIFGYKKYQEIPLSRLIQTTEVSV